jgi:hypothetical protein
VRRPTVTAPGHIMPVPYCMIMMALSFQVFKLCSLRVKFPMPSESATNLKLNWKWQGRLNFKLGALVAQGRLASGCAWQWQAPCACYCY